MISIIIPTYNRSSLIRETLNSIISQEYQNWECIVVDDHSTDNTKEVVSTYIKKDNRFYYLENEFKKGAQGARNTGIVYSKGEYVVLFDSDNIMHPDFLGRTYEAIKKESVDICGSFSRVLDRKTGQIVGKFEWTGYGRIHGDILTCKSYFDNSSTLIKKQKLLDIGLLDESCPSYQEWDTHIRLSKSSTYTTVKELLVDYYRGGEDTISASIEKDVKGILFILGKFKREWILKHPFSYLKRTYNVYCQIQLLKQNEAFKNLASEYKSQINIIYQLFVFLIYKIKSTKLKRFLRNLLTGGVI